MGRSAERFDGSGTPVVLKVGAGLAGTDAFTAFAAAIAPVPKVRVSTVARLGDASLVRVGGVTVDTKPTVTAALEAAVAEHHVDATVEVVPSDRLGAVDAAERAVILRLFPAPGERVDATWVDEALQWVSPDTDNELVLRLLGHDIVASTADAAKILDDAVASKSWIDLIDGDPADELRTASATFGTTPHVALAAGGSSRSDDELVALAERLVAVARRVALTTGYACISIEPTFADIGFGLADDGWLAEGGADPNVVVARLGTTCIPDVFPYQVLTGGHADGLRAGADASDPPVGNPIGGDRFELRIGEFLEWLPDARSRAHRRADAWIEFEALLVRADDLDSYVSGPGHSVDVPAGITITALPQPERGPDISLLQLASWLAGGDHSDAPAVVPTTTAAYARSLASALDNERRAGLRPAAVAMARGDALDDDAAARAALRWLVANANAWIHAAGVEVAISAVDLDDRTAVAHVVQSLAAAIIAATNRTDLAATIVGPASDLLEQITWEVWERVADSTGTTAAAIAATADIDPDVVDAIEDRVISLSRSADPRIVADPTGVPFSDRVWSAATRELAGGAWRAAWELLDEHVGFHWAFSARNALRRALETDPEILGDRDAVDEAIDAADKIAVDALARVSLSGRTHTDPFGAALDAVRAAPNTGRWVAALGAARDAVTTELFDESMSEARAWLAAELQPASQRLQFAVLAAVAREAAGAATRAVAAQAAAPALGRGGTYALAGAAARSEVDPVADRQTTSAIELLHTMAGTPESLRDG